MDELFPLEHKLHDCSGEGGRGGLRGGFPSCWLTHLEGLQVCLRRRIEGKKKVRRPETQLSVRRCVPASRELLARTYGGS